MDIRIRLCKIAKTSDGLENLIELSLRLNSSTPFFQTILELPGIARRPRTKHYLRLKRNLQIDFMLVRRNSNNEVFVFRIFSAVNLNFHLLTLKQSEEQIFNTNGAKPTIYTKTPDKNNTIWSPQNLQ